jgi:hypothetical protein
MRLHPTVNATIVGGERLRAGDEIAPIIGHG